MADCDESKLKRVNHMAHIWKYAHLDKFTCWKPVEHGWNVFPLWLTVFYEDYGYPSDYNDIDDKRMTHSKDESDWDWRTSYWCYERTDKHNMMTEHLTIFNEII